MDAKIKKNAGANYLGLSAGEFSNEGAQAEALVKIEQKVNSMQSNKGHIYRTGPRVADF